LGLKNTAEAACELAQISPGNRNHPAVLAIYYHLHEATKKWELAADTARSLCDQAPNTPAPWIHLAYALHELKRTHEAYEVLLPKADQFPTEYILFYNLACYCCRIGQLPEATRWIKRAAAIAGSEEIKRMAATDPDLEQLRPQIASLF